MRTVGLKARQNIFGWSAPTRNRGALVSIAVFVAIFAATTILGRHPLTYFTVNSTLDAGATLALAAIGQTFVILSGGFDLSSGAIVSLVNALLVTEMRDTLASQVGWSCAALALGGLIGLFNGFFVAYFQLQSIIVTLSTMFLVRGATLLILPSPGGSVPESFSDFFVGDAIAGRVPSALIVLVLAIGVWFVIKSTRLGTTIYAIGSDETAARAIGAPVDLAKVASYGIAGVFYAAAGIFITAQSGAGDPLIGNPLLLGTFTAVVLGGSLLGGGRGGCVGSVFGAFILLSMVNILFVLKVSEYFSSIAESGVLLLAVLANSFERNSVFANTVQRWMRSVQTWPRGVSGWRPKSGGTPASARSNALDESSVWWSGARSLWREGNKELLRFVLPAWICLFLVALATRIAFHDTFTIGYYLDRVLVLGAFPAILALGQGTVIMAGGFDLSAPWSIGLCGIVAAALINGSDISALWVIPLVLALGAAIGLWNGIGVASFGIPPIVMTLATNGLLQGMALIYSGGAPQGYASPIIRWFVTGQIFGVTPIIVFLAAFSVVATLLLSATPFARRIIAVGNNSRAAMLSGVSVNGVVIASYVLSGFCSALVGVLLVGFLGQASLEMGQNYLLPSIAAVVVGGTLITGGRGHYLGMLGGVLLLTGLQILLAAVTLPFAVRDIIFGVVILGSILTLRERSAA